eukprot:3223294-Pyramimonas_sp.AAC.1
MGMSAEAAIFSSPLSSVWTCGDNPVRDSTPLSETTPQTSRRLHVVVVVCQRRRSDSTMLALCTHLPQLDVLQLGVGVDVRVRHAHQLPLAHRRRVGVGALQRVQHHDQRHVVLRARRKRSRTRQRDGLLGRCVHPCRYWHRRT